MAKANRLDAFQAIGRRYRPDGNDIQLCEEVVQEGLPKASAIMWAVANWDNGASWDTVA